MIVSSLTEGYPEDFPQISVINDGAAGVRVRVPIRQKGSLKTFLDDTAILYNLAYSMGLFLTRTSPSADVHKFASDAMAWWKANYAPVAPKSTAMLVYMHVLPESWATDWKERKQQWWPPARDAEEWEQMHVQLERAKAAAAAAASQISSQSRRDVLAAATMARLAPASSSSSSSSSRSSIAAAAAEARVAFASSVAAPKQRLLITPPCGSSSAAAAESVAKTSEKLNSSSSSGKGGAPVTSAIEDCSVCGDNMSSAGKVKQLPHCLHRFHPGCIDTWLRISPTCPVCRVAV